MQSQIVAKSRLALRCNALVLGLSAVLLTLILGACGQTQEGKTKTKPQPAKGQVIAQIGDKALTVEMIEKEINRQNPYVRLRYNSPERKKEFVKSLIRFEVLAAEAKRRNLQDDPEVIRRVKRVMIDKLMEKLQTDLVKLDDISDKEIEAYYNEHKDLYHQPPKVRVSQIVTATEAEARKVYTALQKKGGHIQAFNELVKSHSIDEASKAKNGDLGFFARDDKKLPEPLVKEAFAIKAMWQAGGPVKLDKGWAVLMKTGETAAINRPMELEKNRIKNRLYNEKKIKTIEQYIKDLQKKAKVKIYDENLSKVKVDMAPPRPMGIMPKPGEQLKPPHPRPAVSGHKAGAPPINPPIKEK